MFTLANSSNCPRIYLVAVYPLLGNLLYSMASRTYLVLFSHVLLAVLPLVHSLDIEIDNHCNETLWPALTGQPGDLPLPPALNYKGVFNLSVPENWGGRIWAKSHCTENGSNCMVGDCGTANCNGASSTNTTLIEFNIMNMTIFYDISLGMRSLPIVTQVCC